MVTETTSLAAETPTRVFLRFRFLYPLAVLLILTLGVAADYFLFVRPNYFGYWLTVKPGILVTLAEESGKLELSPYKEARYWNDGGANFHSTRWAATLLFLGLHYDTGLEMESLSVAPFGVVILLLSLLFLCTSIGGSGSPVSRWGFLLSALLLLFSYPKAGWTFHSGGWPAASMGFLMFGLLFAYVRRPEQPWPLALVFLFLFLIFWTYHAMVVTVVVFLFILFGYSLTTRALANLLRAPNAVRVGLYFNLATVGLATLYLDPLFTVFVGHSALYRPWEGIETFFFSIFFRGGETVPYQVSYSLVGKVAVLLPVACLALAATWYWITDHALPLLKGHIPSETGLLLGALYLAAPALLLAAIVSGALRWAEADYLLVVATPLLLTQHLFLRDGASRRRFVAGASVGAGLLAVTIIGSIINLSDPIARTSDVKASDAAVARWADDNVKEPYYADSFYSGLVFMKNPRTPVVSLEEDVKKVGEILYFGPEKFAFGLWERDARYALLGDKNIDKPSPAGRHYIGLSNWVLEPLPDYDFTGPYFEVVYNNGRSRIIRLLPVPLGARPTS